jgi:hypothetical protein
MRKYLVLVAVAVLFFSVNVFASGTMTIVCNKEGSGLYSLGWHDPMKAIQTEDLSGVVKNPEGKRLGNKLMVPGTEMVVSVYKHSILFIKGDQISLKRVVAKMVKVLEDYFHVKIVVIYR